MTTDSTHTSGEDTTGDQVIDHSQVDTTTNQVSEDKGAQAQSTTQDTDANASNQESSQYDDDLAAWAEKTGRPVPATEAEKKLLQEIRNNQRDFHASRQPKDLANGISSAVSEVRPQASEDDDVDPIASKLQQLEYEVRQEKYNRALTEFFVNNNVSQEVADSMGTFLKEKVAAGGHAAYDYWTDPANLKDWHDLAAVRVQAVTGTNSAAEQARLQERQRLAQLQQAQSPQANAQSNTVREEKGYDRDAFFSRRAES